MPQRQEKLIKYHCVANRRRLGSGYCIPAHVVASIKANATRANMANVVNGVLFIVLLLVCLQENNKRRASFRIIH